MFLTRKELSASLQCTQSQDTPVIISSICELQETAPKGVNVEAARLMSVLGHEQTSPHDRVMSVIPPKSGHS